MAASSCRSAEVARTSPVASVAASPAASPPAASSAVADAPPGPDAIPLLDLSAAREPSVVWSFPTNGAEPHAVTGGVLVIDRDERGASLVATATGTRVWQAAAPAGVKLSSLTVGAHGAMVLVSGWTADAPVLLRLDVASGKILWRADGVASDVLLGHDGTGALTSARERCASAPFDLATGRAVPVAIRDTRVEMFGHGGAPPANVCRRSSWPLAARGGVTLVVHRGDTRREEELSGFAADGSVRYRIPLGAGAIHARVALVDGDDVVVLVLGARTEALRLSVVTGQVRHRVTLADEDACAGDGAGPYVEVPTSRGRPSARVLFVRACGRAMLVDAASGARAWEHVVGDDVAFLDGASAAAPWDERAAVMLTSARARRAVFFDEKGRRVTEVPLPDGAREASRLGDGVVVVPSDLGGASFHGAGGDRFRLAARLGSAFAMGDRLVLLESSTSTQVVVKPDTRTAFVVRAGSPWVVGPAGGLWITTTKLDGSSALVGLRAP